MPSKKSTVSIVVIVIVLTLTATVFWYISPALAGPNIDDTWLIAVNMNDAWDPTSAQWVQETYGGTLVDINDPPDDWNNTGQNIFIIGGSHALSLEALWIGLDPEWYAIQRPSTYPEITWTLDVDSGKLHILTPSGGYYSDAEMGMIAKGYDYQMRRWIIVVIGNTYWGTAYGAKLICTQYDNVVTDNAYVVYRYTSNGGTEPTQWSFSDFNGIILEYGG